MQCGRRNRTFSLEDGSRAAYGLEDGVNAYRGEEGVNAYRGEDGASAYRLEDAPEVLQRRGRNTKKAPRRTLFVIV